MGSFSDRAYRLSTGDTVIVRATRSEDAAAVLTHGKAVIDEDEFSVTSSAEYTFTLEEERDWIREYADDPGKLFLIAEQSSRIIGVLFLESGSRRKCAHVATLHMSISRDWRNRGVGTLLLQSAI